MNTHGRTTPRRNNTFFKRALVCALLAPLIYAVTFGSAHGHASPVSENSKHVSVNTADLSTTAIVSPIQSDQRTFECLVCVFHKQLFIIKYLRHPQQSYLIPIRSRRDQLPADRAVPLQSPNA